MKKLALLVLTTVLAVQASAIDYEKLRQELELQELAQAISLPMACALLGDEKEEYRHFVQPAEDAMMKYTEQISKLSPQDQTDLFVDIYDRMRYLKVSDCNKFMAARLLMEKLTTE